ncbi:MAG: GIY-YIG nuclease family protein [Planctomycetota bacterium]|nr:GIY-YIG nuclease family protein [Planctomycetota bacterium]
MYILHCSDGSYYVGATNELQRCISLHNSGDGPQYTALRRPVELLYAEPFDTMEQARCRERQIKKWSRVKKEALINGNRAELKNLSRRRVR